MGHSWGFDESISADSQLAASTRGQSHLKCVNCGCIKMEYVDASGIPQTVYKAPQFTFNPGKVLVNEPPCPATWNSGPSKTLKPSDFG